MEELVRKGPDLAGSRITRGNTHKKPLFLTCPTDLQNLMPHRGVCDPSDCRVAFVSRGQPQEVASAGQRRKYSPVVALPALITNRQSMARTGALDVDRHALYRPDLEGVWKQSR
jgi:hypothetical protein